MAKTTRPATVHYRRLVSVPGMTSHLAGAVDQALETVVDGVSFRDDWHRRIETLHADPPQSRFINNVHSDNLTVFGTLCAYTERQMQALIDTSPTAASADVPVSDAQAPIGSDYLHGIAYWLIVRDHCYVVQHPRVTSKAIEQYLTWLLQRTGILRNAQAIVLGSQFDLTDVGGDLDDVVSIEIGGLAPETVGGHDDATVEVTTRDVEERRSLRELKPTFTKARRVLEGLLGEIGASHFMDNMPDGAALDVTVNIGYRSKKRKIERAGLKDVGTQLRNLGDGDVKIRGRNGTTHGNDARLHMNMPFKLIRANGILLDLEDARTQLRRVHDRFFEDGSAASSAG